MRNYSLGLLFKPREMGDLTGFASSHIYIKLFTIGKDGSHQITPECLSIMELEEEIDRVQAELENIRKQARKKYARHPPCVRIASDRS